MLSAKYVEKWSSLNHEAAVRIAIEANAKAQKLDKKVSVVVLNSGVVLLYWKVIMLESIILKLRAEKRKLSFLPKMPPGI